MTPLLSFIPQITFSDWMYVSYAGNAVIEYFFALTIFGITVITLYVFKTLIIQQFKTLSAKTKVSFDDAIVGMIEGYGWPLYAFTSLYISLNLLEVSDTVMDTRDNVTIIVATYYVIRSLQSLVQYGFYGVAQKRLISDKNFDPAILNLFETMIDILLWCGGVLVVLQNFGFNATTLLGGLGVGGIAIAFALQNVLTDVFASIAIFFDKPFKSGDFIVIGDDMGVVQTIGVKSTRIESLEGQELVISNKELTEVRVNNFKQMKKRRIVFRIGVSYQTSSEDLHKTKEIISTVIDKSRTCSLDRVHFFEFSDSALVFEAVYFVLTGDYQDYMNTQEEINFGIKDGLEDLGIEIAYPTQTVYVKQSKE